MTLFPKTINLKKIVGSYTNGEWVSTYQDVTFVGSVQPLSSREILALDIGRKDIGKVKIYSNSRLFVSRIGSDKVGDLVEFEGNHYEVIQEDIHNNGLISHYKYIAEWRADDYIPTEPTTP